MKRQWSSDHYRRLLQVEIGFGRFGPVEDLFGLFNFFRGAVKYQNKFAALKGGLVPENAVLGDGELTAPCGANPGAKQKPT